MINLESFHFVRTRRNVSKIWQNWNLPLPPTIRTKWQDSKFPYRFKQNDLSLTMLTLCSELSNRRNCYKNIEFFTFTDTQICLQMIKNIFSLSELALIFLQSDNSKFWNSSTSHLNIFILSYTSKNFTQNKDTQKI